MPKFPKCKVPAARSEMMRAIRKTNTIPEQALVSALHAVGLRFRRHLPNLVGCPDVAFERQRIAVFCDGDYWHGKNWRVRKKKLMRGTRPQYWVAKIQGNILRDKRVNRTLRKDGWTVLRFWESEIKKDPIRISNLIAKIVHEVSKRDR